MMMMSAKNKFKAIGDIISIIIHEIHLFMGFIKRFLKN
ncbi:hypothetical protein MBCUT_05380 [Methanobrevibacter cuticularis]|uniref:Uncharacterized protein n=1 Tax=Methanobrevibacter cuticularis TaxID=47311 RepID=A0A166EMN8_9EURY|nr:hypothetical protein MBCUT_05380 [Methanobrevibacter cuticularis]